VKEVTKETFEEDVVQADKPVVVDFWGPQCGPCLALMPLIEQLERDNQNAITVVKVEAPKNRRLCLQLQVLSLPTFLFYKDGQEIDRLAGTVTPLQVKQSIERLAASVQA
jgi:thioredoxin 1